MQIFLMMIFLIVLGLTIFYYKQCEKANKEIHSLECELKDSLGKNKQLENKVKLREEEKEKAYLKAEKKIKDDLYELVFQTMNYGSVKDLENKIKTVLGDVGNH